MLLQRRLGGLKMTKEAATTATVLATQSCWFGADDSNVLLSGGIFPQSAPAGASPICHVVVQGSLCTPFVLSPGDYRYEFNVVNGSRFKLSFFKHGVPSASFPSTFDTGEGGNIDRVTRFSV
jgi:hypothetical protein